MDKKELIEEAYRVAHKPLDIVTTERCIGIIQTVSINECQNHLEHIISYAVHWLYNPEDLKHAWFGHNELTIIGNVSLALAEMAHGSHRESNVKRQLGYQVK